MIRVLLFLLVAGAISLAGTWVLGHNGSVMVEWLGYRVEASLFFLCVTLLGAFVLTLMLVLFLIWLHAAPKRMVKHYAQSRHDKGMVALTQGFAAIASGDVALAAKLAKQATHKLGKTPLTLLLQTQAAQLEGNDGEVSRYLSHLLSHKETELIALKGMLLQAQQRGDQTEAIKLAERAYALKPETVWIAPVLADLYKQTGAWDKARQMLEVSAKRHVPAGHARLLGLLLLSETQQKLRAGDAEAALKSSYRANKLLPGFVPSAVILAAILSQLGKKRKAASMLEQHWETSPHPDLARAYLALYSDEPAEKQLKHLERLISGQPGHAESHRVIARQALLASNFSKARDHLRPLLQLSPTASAYKMMYELDKRENNAAPESLQHWLDKAAQAEQDAAWVCKGCGYSSREGWSQTCPNCGSFDSFEWKEASPVHLLASKAL